MDEEKKQIETNNGDLIEDVVRLFHSHFSEVLDILSSRFPHTKGDESINEKEFNGLRAKVLRSGNNKLRKLPEIVSDYSVMKVRDTIEEQKIMVKTPVIMPEGIDASSILRDALEDIESKLDKTDTTKVSE